jgi:hypothetical protein
MPRRFCIQKSACCDNASTRENDRKFANDSNSIDIVLAPPGVYFHVYRLLAEMHGVKGRLSVKTRYS